MFTYTEERIDQIQTELETLLTDHWDELAVNKDQRPLNVDWDKYKTLQDEDVCKVVTVRKDGTLVGYACFMIVTNLHYKNWKVATCDVYYVTPSERKSGLGLEFFKVLIKYFDKLGVNSICVHDKIKKPHTKLFEALGFTAIETTYEMVM